MEIITHSFNSRNREFQDFLVSSDHASVHVGSLLLRSLTGGQPGHPHVSTRHRLYHLPLPGQEHFGRACALLPRGIVVEPSRIGVPLHTELGC